MTDEVTKEQAEVKTEAVEQQQQTAEQIEQAEDTDFAAGYGRARGDEPPIQANAEEKKESEKQEPVKQEAQKQEPEKQEPAKVEEPPKVFGMTEAEFKAEVAKSGQTSVKVNEEIRKVYGKLGEITRTVQELTKNLSAGKTSRKITAEALKRVNDELPGLGAALAQDLSDILGGAEAAQAATEAKGEAFDPEKWQQEKLAPALEAMEARIAEVSDQAQHELLAFMQPDYETYLKTDEFRSWLQTLPADRREFVVSSPRAAVAGAAIKEAKEWGEGKRKAEKEKAKNLEKAIPTKAGAANPVTQVQDDDEAAFSKGYKKARSR